VPELPAMSVIVVTRAHFEAVRAVIKHLRAQTVRAQLEIVIVAPSVASVVADLEMLRDFQCFQLVECGNAFSTSVARATGVRRAVAPIVALVEDHSWPQPAWAEKLIAAHRQPCAAVGPALVNGNPETLTSWTNLLIEYGAWIDPAPQGAQPHLPGHNSSYKRERLLAYGDRLEVMFEAESVLHWDLRAQGHELLLEAEAKTVHYNFSLLGPSLRLRFCVGRLFASSRARDWPVARRLAYALAAPLIPCLRFGRIVKMLQGPGRLRHLLPRLAPLLFLALALDATGEFTGYLTGPGHAGEKLNDIEFDRPRNMTTADRLRFEAASR